MCCDETLVAEIRENAERMEALASQAAESAFVTGVGCKLEVACRLAQAQGHKPRLVHTQRS